MPVQNLAIASNLEEVGDRLAIQGANPFRIRAYHNAARMLQELRDDVKQMIARGDDLTELPGIGPDLAGKITKIALTGKSALVESLRRAMPPAVTELLKVPGLGPKRVAALWHDLGVQTPKQVLRAARDGRIRALTGFGEKTERNIEHAVAAHLSKEHRTKLAVAAQYADALTSYLQTTPGVERVVVAGSYRRMRETVGDLDILVSIRGTSPAAERFVGHPDVVEVMSQGGTRASVRLRSGMQVDLHIVPSDIPELVEYSDLRGDLHTHTKATDGRNTLEEMVASAQALGFEYLAITEHSRRQAMVHGFDPDRLLRQVDAIDQLNRSLTGIRVLKGIEVDILDDGNLDLPDTVLAKLDSTHGRCAT